MINQPTISFSFIVIVSSMKIKTKITYLKGNKANLVRNVLKERITKGRTTKTHKLKRPRFLHKPIVKVAHGIVSIVALWMSAYGNAARVERNITSLPLSFSLSSLHSLVRSSFLSSSFSQVAF